MDANEKKKNFLDRFFGYTKAGSSLGTEVMAGVTTFFAMAYVLFVIPGNLSEAGMNWGAVFLATIISSVIGTLIMGLVANVPYAQAPGLGLAAFFVWTVCVGLGFTWQEALSMVFICGLINVVITVTKVRKFIIKAIPLSLQHAIGGGIGLFVAYIGLLNVDIINFSAGVPSFSALNTPEIWVFLIGLILILVLHFLKIKGAMLISIIITAIIGIPFGITKLGDTVSVVEACQALPETFGAIFTKAGIVSLFSNVQRLPLVLITIFSFSITDTFDTIGTFIGTGRRTGIFSEEEERNAENSTGFKTRLDRALFADATATSIGAIFGATNTTTFVESAAGIGAGGRTGLASVVTAICFILSAFLSGLVSAVPSAATAPALIMVGIMMIASFKSIDWENLDDAAPAFFASVFMALSYNISYGIAMGFIIYCLVKICRGKIKEIHPILWGCVALFILNFVLLALPMLN